LDVVIAIEIGGEPVNEVVGESFVHADEQNVIAGRRVNHPMFAGK